MNVKMIAVLALLCLTLAANGQPLARYTFNDGSAIDVTGNGFDGTLLGSAAVVNDSERGPVMQINASGMQATGPFEITTAFTLSAWIQIDQPRTGRFFFGGPGWQLRTDNNAGATEHHWIEFRYPGGAFVDKFDTRTADNADGQLDGQWHHYVFILEESGDIKVYFDGVLAPFRDGSSKAHDYGAGGIETIFFGTQNETGGNALQGHMDDIRVFNYAVAEEEIPDLMKESANTASRPLPGDMMGDVPRTGLLSWMPGETAASQDVYLGTSFDDVNEATRDDGRGVLVSQGQTETTYAVESLTFGQQMFWRVDSVEASGTIHKGSVWRFTVEPFAYPLVPIAATASSSQSAAMGPENTINGSGLNESDQHGTTATDMWLSGSGDIPAWIQYEFDKAYKLHELWIWNSNQVVEAFVGFGAKVVNIEVSTDNVNWTVLENAPEFARATGQDGYEANTQVDLSGTVARYVRFSIQAGHGVFPQFGLSEVRFFSIPTHPREPQPADGGVADSIDITLQWRAGREAETHEIALSSDQTAVESGTAPVNTAMDSSYNPGTLDYGTAYFWQVTEVNALETPSQYTGPIWTFTSPEYLVIDDFEAYKDEEFLEIWAFWADGYQDNSNGALVGNGNIGERTVVYEGRQSMPIHYDNSSAAVSEVTREFTPALNLQNGNPSVLSLQVRGDAPDFVENADGTILIGAAGADIHGIDDDFRFVYRQLSGNGSIVVRVHSIDHTHNWAKAGPMIRENLTPESTMAALFLTPANGVQATARTTAFANAATDSATPEQGAITGPVWLRVERVGSTFNYYYALDEAGINWVTMSHSGQTIEMLGDVYIGLAVTSHSVGNTTTGTFSGAGFTGGVSGAWTAEAIGGEHPSNDAAPLYLRLADTSGGEYLVRHPNETVAVSTTWDVWQVELSAAAINLRSIESITIGLGHPGAAAGGAQGTLYVDLLQAGTPLMD